MVDASCKNTAFKMRVGYKHVHTYRTWISLFSAQDKVRGGFARKGIEFLDNPTRVAKSEQNSFECGNISSGYSAWKKTI